MMPQYNPVECVRCKGMKLLCGRPQCPILMKAKVHEKVQPQKEIQGETPSVFIGDFGWPKVYVGPLSVPFADSQIYDAPEQWYGLPLEQIVDYRMNMFRGKQTLPIDIAKNPTLELLRVQEVAMAKKPPDTLLEFRKEPRFTSNFSPITPPFGPSEKAELFIVEGNPNANQKIEKIVNDELKSVSAINMLYKDGVEVNNIMQVLSVGLLGINKKLVPTKWSITATDDTISKQQLENIRDYDEISEYLLFRGNFLDNWFQILLVPGKWSYEQVEFYEPGSLWTPEASDVFYSSDFETYHGRTKYAENVVGGYYAGRIAVTEYLEKIKRQATVFVLREIRKGYVVPVGVWEVRENARHSLQNKPTKFNNLDEALAEIGNGFKAKRGWEKNSELLKIVRSREMFKKYLQA